MAAINNNLTNTAFPSHWRLVGSLISRCVNLTEIFIVLSTYHITTEENFFLLYCKLAFSFLSTIMLLRRSNKYLSPGRLKFLRKPLKSRGTITIVSHPESKKPPLPDSKSKSCSLPGVKSKHSVLVRLPFELILKVASFLPNTSKKALSFTCQQFFRCRESLYSESTFSKSDQFKFQCMLERDQIFSKLACAGCETAHMQSWFLPEELKKAAYNRYCIRTKPMLWICPFQFLSFEDMRDIYQSVQQNPTVPGPIARWTLAPCSHNSLLTSGGHDFVIRGDWLGLSIVDRLTILKLQPHEIPSRRKIEIILKACNLQACPHIQLGDLRIAHSYNPTYFFYGERRFPYKVVKCSQSQCKTFIGFIYPSKGGVGPAGDLLLEINRQFGELKSPKDPTWLSQLIYPNHQLMTHHWSIGITKLKALQKLECSKTISKDAEYISSFMEENVYSGSQPPFSLVWRPASI